MMQQMISVIQLTGISGKLKSYILFYQHKKAGICRFPFLGMAEFFIVAIKTRFMLTNQYQSVPYMKSLTSCLNKMVSEGYTEDFKVTEEGMKSLQSEKFYKPEEVKVVNFFRFEGASDPEDMSILYVIETSDGIKGTLIDAYGTYSDANVNNFMLEVENINKKTEKRSDQ